MIDKPVYLTPEGLAQLKAELKDRVDVQRPAIAESIKQAKDLGDLSENSEYEAAKNAQAFNEGRIRELTYMVNNAQLIEDANGSKEVRIGSTVTIRNDDGDEETYTIVGSSEAKPAQGRISNESPMGKALIGKRVKQKVAFDTPGGTEKFTILKIK